MKNSGLIIGLALIGAAWAISRRGGVTPGYGGQPMSGPPMKSNYGGAGSMPASVGTGIAQPLGGIFGNLFAPQSGGGTSTGAPPENAVQPLLADNVLQNSDVPNTQIDVPQINFDPTSGAWTGG